MIKPKALKKMKVKNNIIKYSHFFLSHNMHKLIILIPQDSIVCIKNKRESILVPGWQICHVRVDYFSKLIGSRDSCIITLGVINSDIAKSYSVVRRNHS